MAKICDQVTEISASADNKSFWISISRSIFWGFCCSSHALQSKTQYNMRHTYRVAKTKNGQNNLLRALARAGSSLGLIYQLKKPVITRAQVAPPMGTMVTHTVTRLLSLPPLLRRLDRKPPLRQQKFQMYRSRPRSTHSVGAKRLHEDLISWV